MVPSNFGLLFERPFFIIIAVIASIKNKYLYELLTLASSILWGSSFVAIKIGLKHIDPLWFVQLRMFSAFVILYLTFNHRIYLKKYLAMKSIWLLGVFHALAYCLQFMGMPFISASAAAFYVNLAVVFTAVFSFFLLKEYFGGAKIIGLLLATAGIFLLSTNGDVMLLEDQSILMGFLVIVSGMFWAMYTVINKKILSDPQIEVLPLTASVLLISSILLLVPATILGTWPTQWSLHSGSILAYTIVFCTLLPFLLFAKGLRGISPTISATILLTEPIFAVLFAYPILGELFKSFEALGAVLIFLALGVISFSK
ncbi:MAG TPA: DMT family transporter [bacterium]